MSEKTVREEQLENLIAWCLPRLTRQTYVDYAKARMKQCPYEWKAERDEGSYYGKLVQSKE